MEIVIIGIGNVGSHLTKGFLETGSKVVQLYSRNSDKTKALASRYGIDLISDYKKLRKGADLYLLTVHDSAIKEVAQKVVPYIGPNALLAHTSGATPSTVFKDITDRYGVFYPLQTFSKDLAVDFSNIPFCLDAVEEKDLIFFEKLARKLSPKVYRISDEQRAILHVAAVFVSNFTNHLAGIGKSIVEKEDISFDLLMPLLLESITKLQNITPKDAQTGPAIRGDRNTIERHLNYLERYPDYQNIYKLLSNSINSSLHLK